MVDKALIIPCCL